MPRTVINIRLIKMRFRSAGRPTLAMHRLPTVYNLLLLYSSLVFQFLGADDVLASSGSSKSTAKQHNHRRHGENQNHPNRLSSLTIHHSPELERKLFDLLQPNRSRSLDTNVHQLSQFDHPLLNQLLRKQQKLNQQNAKQNMKQHIVRQRNTRDQNNQTNDRVQPKRKPLRTKKIEPIESSVDYELTNTLHNNSAVPAASPLQATTVKSTFEIFPFLKYNFSRARSDKEGDPLNSNSLDNGLDNVLKKSVDENILISGHYHSFPDQQAPENKFYTFCREFRERFLSVHGYLSLSVCIFGIIANILNIIVLTR